MGVQSDAELEGLMAYWETADTAADQPPVIRDFAEIWQAADKIVFSRTLEQASSSRTRR